MQESTASGHHHRHQIVVPSRSDPLLRTMTEAIGGPMGRRTAPGRTNPGFFTVERVLVLMAAASAVIAVMGKFHCRQAGWTTPDQYSTVCWSVFPNSFTEHKLGALFPFFSPGATFDYPPLAGMIAGATAWLTRGAGEGALRQLAFFDMNAALIAVVWIITVVVVARTAGRRPWDAAIVAASPLLLLTAYVSWDFWAVGLVSLGLYLFARGSTILAGAVIGLAAMVAPYALLILLVLLVLGIRARKILPAIEAIVAAGIAWLLVLTPILISNPSAWGAYLAQAITEPPSDSSLYGGYNLVAERLGAAPMSVDAANAVALILLALVVAAVVMLGLFTRRRPRLASLSVVAVAGLIVVGKFSQPWDAIWLLPLLALALPRWRPLLLWQAAVITHFIALMLFQSKQLGNIADTHAIDMPYFVLAALLGGAATCAIVGLTIRDMLHPGHDLIRRGGVDDPQLGALGTDLQDAGPEASAQATEKHGQPRHG